MGPGSALLLSIGTGIGIALYSGADWWWQGLIGAIFIAIASIIFKSEHFRDYVENCSGREVNVESPTLQKMIIQPTGPVKPSISWFLLLQIIQNSIVIFIVAAIILVIRRLI